MRYNRALSGGAKLAEQIKFGTEGWRGITAYEFTYANVLFATEAVARHFTCKLTALSIAFDACA